MKFKLLSLVLLLVCFVFLGVLAGVIPVTDQDAAEAFSTSLRPAQSPDASPAATEPPVPGTATPRVIVPPTPRLAGTAAPVSTSIITGPTAAPVQVTSTPARTTVSVGGGTSSPSAAPSPVTAAQSAAPAPTDTGMSAPGTSAPEAASASTPEHVPTATPEPAPEPTATPEPVVNGWEPDAEVISTTITWHDPLQNDTDIELEDASSLLEQELSLTLPSTGPQILIIHTHGTEAYTPDGADQYEATADYRTIDTDHTVIRVGQALADALESYGLRVIVDTELYDWPSYNGSYNRAEQAIRQYLEENPDLAMIIDLHRDALGDDEVVYKTVSDELDTPAAQMMFVVGTDETLDHPNWRQNLALAVELQGLVEAKYPHLTRPTLVCPYRYNQQFTPGSVLLEIGTAGNTLQEALTSAKLFADAAGPALAACAAE